MLDSRWSMVYGRSSAWLAAVLLLAQGPALARPQPPTDTSQHEIVERHVLPHIEFLFHKLVAEKRETTLDGVKVFEGGDRFLPGKVALGLSALLVETPRSDPRFAGFVRGYREIADMTVGDPNDTWGIYYYLSALNKLRKAGLLDEAVSPETLANLRVQLDWRLFVSLPEYTVIKLPTNYLGVAFSIARLRMLLGWEDGVAGDRLLQKILEHYDKYSGEFGFSDETDGAGRFDRYSVLLIGEIGERLIETEMPITPQVRAWLRKSADVVLVNLNARGDGFSYGRSIGPYGDTAFLEVLAAAAYFDVLTAAEKEMAYAFATRAVRKYVEFWLDQDMKSVNMWERGRATEQYRNKSRILGENFSLADQLIKTNDIWNQIGYRNRQPSDGLERWLRTLPAMTLTWFARGEHDRALLTRRDGTHVISLPIISGGPSYHSMNTYFPIPYAHRLVQGSPNAGYPQLLPMITLEDGAELMPLVYTSNVTLKGNTLAFRQAAMNRLGQNAPVRDDRLTSDVRFEFSSGRIRRAETYRAAKPLKASLVVMEFGSFSSRAAVRGTTVSFSEGDVTSFAVEGLQTCEVFPVTPDSVYKATHGPMRTVVRCQSKGVAFDRPVTIAWTLRF